MLSIVCALAAGAADLPSVEPPSAELRYPYANELFDRDPALKAWAVRLHDRNRDGWLTLYEAQPAMEEFRQIADGNGDGRVTTYEYRTATAFIRARWPTR